MTAGTPRDANPGRKLAVAVGGTLPYHSAFCEPDFEGVILESGCTSWAAKQPLRGSDFRHLARICNWQEASVPTSVIMAELLCL